MESTEGRTFRHLLLSAAAGTLICLALLFGFWYAAFIIMGFLNYTLLVGMYFLAWPIVFPIVAAIPIFVLLVGTVPLFPGPYRVILTSRRFIFSEFIPLVLLAFALMLATCPLDTGGTLLSRGWAAFGRSQ